MMPNRDWSRLEMLIEAALAVPAGQRDQLLIDQSAGDEELLHDARSLLAQLDADPGFLEPPAAPGGDGVTGDSTLPSIPGW